MSRPTSRPRGTPSLLVGSNDGYLHVLDARVGQATSGQELFGFVPRALMSTLEELSLPTYAHRYYVDGPIVEGDVWNGTAWKTIAVGSTGAGKAGLFALDITSPQSGFDEHECAVGHRPQRACRLGCRGSSRQRAAAGRRSAVSRTRGAANGAGRWVYITGNGYESVKNEATLLVFDLFTGALIKAIKTGDGNAGNPNGIGAITPVYDGNRNIIAIYGGDKRGNLWKFDLSSDTPNDPDGGGPLKGWGIFNNDGSQRQAIVQRDRLYDCAPADFVGAADHVAPAGRAVRHVSAPARCSRSTDPASTQVQALYVLWDKGQVAPIVKGDLQQIALQEFSFDHDANAATPDEKYRRLKAADLAAFDWNDDGFYMPLINEGGTAEGERVLVAPILDAGTLAVTTYAPTAGTDQCVPGGASYLYRFNLAGNLDSSGFLTTGGTLIANAAGRRIQPGLVSSAPPLHDPVAPTG